MKTALLFAVIGLTISMCSLEATQNLSFSGPSNWTQGTSIVLSTTDTYSGFGGGSWGLSYSLVVDNTIDPFLWVTGVSYFTFTSGYPGPFPVHVGDIDYGASSGALVPDGSYHVTDITFALMANAPAGTYTLRTTTAAPRGSIQVTSDFGDAPFPQASFVFTVVPEPSTLALFGIGAAGSGVLTYRRRKNRGGATGKSA